MTYVQPIVCEFGPTLTGLTGSVGYLVRDPVTLLVRVARTAAGVAERAGTGVYVAAPFLDPAWGPVEIAWDITGAAYAGFLASEILTPIDPGSPPFPPTVTTGAGLMAAVVIRLRAAVGAAFGDSDETPKFHADEVDPGCDLPYALHSEPEEVASRFFGGQFGEGTFELGVFAAGYETARELADLARATLDQWPLPVTLGDGGILFYIRSASGTARPIHVTAPGSGVTHYGRAVKFAFKVARNDPS